MMTTWLRAGILAAADRNEIEQLVRHSRFSRALVNRFVAGETVSEALAAAKGLAGQGLKTTLDQLGENVLTPAEATAAVDAYADTLRSMAAAGLEPNISIKLTMGGLDIDDDVAHDNMVALLETAATVEGFVRIDMEGSAYTERTLAIAEALHERFPGQVGTVIQAYLHRSDRDVERLIDRQMRVRLVKGAYAEPANIAIQNPREIDENFVRLMERLLEHGRYPAIATHDPAIILATQGFALRLGIERDRWEFQMLYGVRRDAQTALADEGYRMRIYVPFGADWYPYFARRIAERPANMAFVFRQLFTR
ncbi:MAG TPA: proline dehydrogenase family protein [Thermomicrobiales bacterium]|nr:proline dehydrogenase family protein [Thermomicrobiales bacterium]